MSNVIHNMNPKNMEVVFQPIDRNDILKSVKRLELYMNIKKNNRARSKPDFFNPVVVNQPIRKKKTTKSKNNIETDFAELESNDSSDGTEKMKEDFSILLEFREKYDIQKVPYPDDCVKLEQKIEFAKKFQEKANVTAHNNNERINFPSTINNSAVFAKVLEALKSKDISDDIIDVIDNVFNSMSIGSANNNSNNNNKINNVFSSMSIGSPNNNNINK